MYLVLTRSQTAAWGTRCGGGGLPWNPTGTYVNAITNELFLSVAAHLANRVPSKREEYIRWAQREWDWFTAQAFIGQNGTINDGLLENCQNNGATVYVPTLCDSPKTRTDRASGGLTTKALFWAASSN